MSPRGLERLDSCAIADAGDALGIRVWLPGLVAMAGRRCISGRCVTVLLGPPTPATTSRHLCTSAVEAAGPGDVIVVAHQGRLDCAGWGGNLSRAAKRRGNRGHHRARCRTGHRRSRRTRIRRHRDRADTGHGAGRTQEQSWGQPVDLDGVEVNHGDWVLADRSGVVFVPADRVVAVLDRAEAVAAREAAMAAAIDAGQSVGTVMGATYETMLTEPS